MSDNKHTIPDGAIEPSENRRPDSAMDPAHWAQDAANADSQLVREYREAFLLIYKVHEQMKGPAVDGNLTMVDDETEEGQALPLACPGLPVGPPRARAGHVLPAMTFAELTRRFIEQMEEVVATGKQIAVDSRQMASGVKELNEGLGMLKQELSRVKS